MSTLYSTYLDGGISKPRGSGGVQNGAAVETMGFE